MNKLGCEKHEGKYIPDDCVDCMNAIEKYYNEKNIDEFTEEIYWNRKR